MKIRAIAALILFCASGIVAAQNAQPPRSPLVDKPTCTRAELQAATAAYIEAQRTGNISKLLFADNAQFLENMSPVEKTKGLWNTALPIAYSMSFHDDKRCKTYSEVIITEGDHPYVLGTRLYMHEGKILRIDSLVTDRGDWAFNANAYLKYSKQEAWTPLATRKRVSGQKMIDGANAYLDSFSDKFMQAPWGRPCERLEGGMYTNREGKADSTCQVGVPAGLLYIVNRDYLVDEEMGVVNIFCRFGNSSTGMPDSHTFRYVRGKYRNIHTLSVNLNPDSPSPQATDDGGLEQPMRPQTPRQQ